MIIYQIKRIQPKPYLFQPRILEEIPFDEGDSPASNLRISYGIPIHRSSSRIFGLARINRCLPTVQPVCIIPEAGEEEDVDASAAAGDEGFFAFLLLVRVWVWVCGDDWTTQDALVLHQGIF